MEPRILATRLVSQNGDRLTNFELYITLEDKRNSHEIVLLGSSRDPLDEGSKFHSHFEFHSHFQHRALRKVAGNI